MLFYIRSMLFYERKLSPSGEFRQLMKKKIYIISLQRHCSLFFLWRGNGFGFFFVISTSPTLPQFFYVPIILVCTYSNYKRWKLYSYKTCNAIEHYNILWSDQNGKVFFLFFLLQLHSNGYLKFLMFW